MRLHRSISTGLFVCFVAFAQSPQTAGTHVPDQLIVHHRGDAADPAAARLFAAHGALALRVMAPLKLSVIRVAPAQLEAVAQALRADPTVAEVEYDYYARVAAVPNDPSYSAQWHLAKIQAPNAWDRTGGSAMPIAILDSGVDSTHPDLGPRVMAGWNYIYNNSNTSDLLGHGTAVAGTAAAVTNNGLGVAGVTWWNPIMPLVVIDSTGYAAYSNVAAAIQYATDHGARVINVSLGGTSPSSALQNAVDYAWNAGAIVVASAMNNSNSTPEYPAACNHAIAVSATDENDNLAGFSDYGSWITLSAPGNDILTTMQGGGYGYWYGTSFSAPIVSSVAALALAVNPSLTAQSLVTLLEQNSDDLGTPGYDTSFGWGRINAYRAVSAAAGGGPPPPGGGGSATFIKTDVTTQGSWRSSYGADGYNVINNATAYPAYVTATPSGNYSYTWVPSTTDVRGELKAGASDRIGACWYNGSSMSLDLNFTDGNTHQVAIYLLDWEYAGRSERVDIVDGNNNLLDTRTASGFGYGQYLVWNLSGHVIIRVTNLNGASNGVISGVFFGAGAAAGGSAAFLKTDVTTQGSWKGVYGGDGYNVINNSASYPGYVAVTPSGNSSYTWVASTSDSRGLLKATASDRIASCWYTGSSMSVDLNFTDGNAHQVALYLVDWDYYGPRSERIDIVDANNNVLDTRTVSSFWGGIYLVWNLGGHVIVRITNLYSNAVISGIFFGAGSSQAGSAHFLKSDTTTQGSWSGVYGADGYNVINYVAAYPGYVAATPSGNASYTWAASATDIRALQKPGAGDRIASCWYTGSSMNLDLNFTDGNTHQVALYLVDWDYYGPRSERVDIVDTNNNVLDTRTVSSFWGGIYLVWNLGGHVTVRVTNTNGASNAVMSGVFFR
ncbi:MAG: hypothetical protein C5B51_13005 [Terriglobia bacterium]|nr:MAG: hypothetical protein C5B51_13005 [Terriglobia bacterium]